MSFTDHLPPEMLSRGRLYQQRILALLIVLVSLAFFLGGIFAAGNIDEERHEGHDEKCLRDSREPSPHAPKYRAVTVRVRRPLRVSTLGRIWQWQRRACSFSAPTTRRDRRSPRHSSARTAEGA